MCVCVRVCDVCAFDVCACDVCTCKCVLVLAYKESKSWIVKQANLATCAVSKFGHCGASVALYPVLHHNHCHLQYETIVMVEDWERG